MQEKIGNYVIFPRKIAADYRNGVITLDEMNIYSWLRLNANPYGISITSLSSLSDDLFRGKKSENYINKLILSLKEKRFIYYEKRSGRRGSFEVHLGDFLLPTKKITSLDKFFKTEVVRGATIAKDRHVSETSQSSASNSQSLDAIKNEIRSLVSSISGKSPVRASNNDTNTDKDNKYKYSPSSLDDESLSI